MVVSARNLIEKKIRFKAKLLLDGGLMELPAAASARSTIGVIYTGVSLSSTVKRCQNLSGCFFKDTQFFSPLIDVSIKYLLLFSVERCSLLKIAEPKSILFHV